MQGEQVFVEEGPKCGKNLEESLYLGFGVGEMILVLGPKG